MKVARLDPMAPIGLAYRRDNRSATVRNFVALPRKRAERFGVGSAEQGMPQCLMLVDLAFGPPR
jgi:hypothetical protein